MIFRILRLICSLTRNRYVKLFICAICGILVGYWIFQISEMILDDEVPGWGRDRSRDTRLYIVPNKTTATLLPSKVCRENTPILLLFVVISALSHFENRRIIRKTWANEFNYDMFSFIHSTSKTKYSPISYANWKEYAVNKNASDFAIYEQFQIRTVFIVGQTKDADFQNEVVIEAAQHDDIIQEQFVESYNNLTLKSLMMLKFVNDNCIGKVKYVMKVDDDIFVNVPNLIHYVLGGGIPAYLNNKHEVLTKFDDVLFGFYYKGHNPIRNMENKWYMPYYMYEQEHYPGFISGGSYVFSIDVAEKLYKTAMDTPLLHLEDVYLTGICAEKAHINRTSASNNLFNFVIKQYCHARGVISLEELRIHDLPKVYNLLLTSNITCPKHYRRKKKRRTLAQRKLNPFISLD